MKKYDLFWREFFIGKLSINDKGKYMFIVDEEEKKKAIDAGMLSILVPAEQREWGEKIAFFEERIRDNILSVNKFHTDEFRLKKRS